MYGTNTVYSSNNWRMEELRGTPKMEICFAWKDRMPELPAINTSSKEKQFQEYLWEYRATSGFTGLQPSEKDDGCYTYKELV